MEDLAIFRLMDAKLAYNSQRQGVLANNIANANTPGFLAKDVKAPDFKKMLSDTGLQPAKVEGLKATNGMHIEPLDTDSSDNNVYTATSYDISPDGNSVDLEEQMLKASKNNSEVGIVISLYAKQLSFLRTAVGAGR